jgi:hypothetical protein
MKIKLTISLFLILIFCGAASAQPANKKPEAGARLDMPVVPLCEAVSHPARYKNKVVRMEAIYLVYYHGAYLYGAQCNELRMYVDPSIPCRGENDSSCIESQRALDKLVEPHLRWDENKSARRAKVILVGRFRRVYPRYRDGRGNLIVRVGPNADLRFELRIIRTESASPVADGGSVFIQRDTGSPPAAV